MNAIEIIRPWDGTKPKLTQYNDEKISNRHRQMFGKNMPFINFDFVGMHYDNGIVTDFVEFKHCNIKEIKLNQSNYLGLQDAADKLGVPFFIIIYDDTNWSYYMMQFNKNPNVKKWCPSPRIIREKDLVKGLYKIRGRSCPPDILKDLSETKFAESKIPVISGYEK